MGITATLPNGHTRTFAEVASLDAYVRVWREAGYRFTWISPRNVRITR